MTDERMPTLAETYMRADYTGDSPRRLNDHRRMSHNAGLLAVYNLGVQHGKDHRAEAGDGTSTTDDPAPSGSPLSNLNGEGDPQGIWACQTCGGSLATGKDRFGTHQCPPKDAP